MVFEHQLEDGVIARLATEAFDGNRYRMTRPRNVNNGETMRATRTVSAITALCSA